MSTDQGQKLFDKLSELNYPKISKFNPSSFDWLFDSDEALPFLDWFCDSIHSGLHLLSDSELKKFEALEKSGVTILEGDLLQEALSGRSEEEVTDEDLEAEIEQLRSRKEQLLAGKQNSIRQLNQLNAQEKAASVKISAAEEEAGAAEMAEEKLVEKLSLQSSIVHQVAAQLVDTTASIVERLGGSRLLCQTDLQQFLQHEEDYTALLTKYANTQFQEKMAAMGQNSGSELCAFVKIGDPNDLADILGLDAETRVIQNWELDRLQNLLPLAEEDRIVSQAEAAASRAAVDAAKALLNDLDAGRFPSSPVRIKMGQEETEQRNEAYRKEGLSLKAEVAAAVRKSTAARCSSVLVGDCSLKLVRQQLLLSKQKQFLAFLARQWAREQLLALAVRLEARHLDALVAAVADLARRFDDDRQQLRQRLNGLQEAIDAEKTLRERNTVPAGDVATRSLLAALERHDAGAGALANYEQVAAAAAELRRRRDAARDAHRRLADQQIQQQGRLEETARRMEELVFGAPLASITQPLSRSAALGQAVHRLDAGRDAVKTRFVPLYKDFKARQSAVKNDHLTALERRLWTLFYADPASMQRKTDALNAKAYAF